MRFYDRTNEIAILHENEQMAKQTAQFCVLMGRRRVGKTSLIGHAMEGRDWAYQFVSKDSEAVLCGKMQSVLEDDLGIYVYGRITKFRDLFEVIMAQCQTSVDKYL